MKLSELIKVSQDVLKHEGEDYDAERFIITKDEFGLVINGVYHKVVEYKEIKSKDI